MLLIIARLIAEYKHSNEALVALENFFLAKIFGYKPNPLSCRAFTSFQFNLVQKSLGIYSNKYGILNVVVAPMKCTMDVNLNIIGAGHLLDTNFTFKNISCLKLPTINSRWFDI